MTFFSGLKNNNQKGILMKHAIIDKCVIPNRYHKADKGTIARVVHDYQVSYYVQISPNTLQPNWLPLATVLEKALEKQFKIDTFIEQIIQLYENAISNSKSDDTASITTLINQ